MLSPCALGAVFTPATIPRLRCRAIAGAANNQLGTIDDGDALHARGIIYAAGLHRQRRRHHQHRGRVRRLRRRAPARAHARHRADGRPRAGAGPRAGRLPRPRRRDAGPRADRGAGAARQSLAARQPDGVDAGAAAAEAARLVIPLRDNVPTLRRPMITWLIIIVNCAVFLFSIAQPARSLPRYDGDGRASISGFDAITLEYGFTPCELASSATGRTTARRCPAGTADTSTSAEVRVHRAAGLAHAPDRHVHARRLAAPDRQHAVPVRVRQQRRGRHEPRARSCSSTCSAASRRR